MEAAAEWLDAYDPAPSEDFNGPHMEAVAAWLRDQARRKATKEAETAAIREHAKRLGKTPGQVRRALKRVREARQ
jgi:hypothetical protein